MQFTPKTFGKDQHLWIDDIVAMMLNVSMSWHLFSSKTMHRKLKDSPGMVLYKVHPKDSHLQLSHSIMFNLCFMC